MVFINLLNWRNQLRKTRLNNIITCFSSYLAIVLLSLFISLFYFKQHNQNLTYLIEQLSIFQTRLQQHLNQLTQQQTIYQINHDISKQKRIQLLQQIIQLLPQHIWLTDLLINHDSITIKGNTTHYLALIEFQQAIIDNHLANSTHIPHLQQKPGTTVYAFHFLANY